MSASGEFKFNLGKTASFQHIERGKESSFQGEVAGWLGVLSKGTHVVVKVKIDKENHSALLFRMTQLLETIANCLTHTESAEEPVIRMSAAVIDGPAVATVVIATLASRGWGTPGKLWLGRP